VEVEKIADLYLERGDNYQKVIEAKIRNVEEVEKETKIRKKMDWIRRVCDEFQMTPETFLKAFKDNKMKYAPTAKKFSTKSKNLTASKVKKLVRGLYEFPEIYGAVLGEPPNGVPSRHTNIVKFPKRK
jgi:hypothetical protein